MYWLVYSSLRADGRLVGDPRSWASTASRLSRRRETLVSRTVQNQVGRRGARRSVHEYVEPVDLDPSHVAPSADARNELAEAGPSSGTRRDAGPRAPPDLELPSPPSTGLPSTWLTRMSPWRIAKHRTVVEQLDRQAGGVAQLRRDRRPTGRGPADIARSGGQSRDEARSATSPASAGRTPARSIRRRRATRRGGSRASRRSAARRRCPAGVIGPVRPAEALPGPDDVRVVGVDPVSGEARTRRGGSPSIGEPDRTGRASTSPSAFDWSSVPFQTAIATRPSASRDAHASTSDPRAVAVERRSRARRRRAARASRSAQKRGLRRLPIVSSPNPPWNSARRLAELDEVVRRDPVGERVERGRPPSASRGRRAARAQTLSLIGAPWLGADAPLGPPQRQVGPAVPGERSGGGRAAAHAVRVGRDEVDRDDLAAAAVLEQVVDPAGRGRRRAADPERRVDRLDGPRGRRRTGEGSRTSAPDQNSPRFGSFQTSNAQRRDLVAAEALDEVARRGRRDEGSPTARGRAAAR